ncbi:methionyl-tRNA formyltransferase, partial [Rhodococcus sp. NPDC058514]
VLLDSVLDGIEDGALIPTPQPAEGVSHAPKVTVESARIRWDRSAQAVDRLVRSVTPAPGAWTQVGELRLKVGPVQVTDEALEPGQFLVRKDGCYVGTATTAVRLSQVQPQGKKAMAAADWARGARLDPEVRAQ